MSGPGLRPHLWLGEPRTAQAPPLVGRERQGSLQSGGMRRSRPCVKGCETTERKKVEEPRVAQKEGSEGSCPPWGPRARAPPISRRL